MSDKSVAQMQREILCAGYYLRLTYGSGFTRLSGAKVKPSVPSTQKLLKDL